MNVLVRYGVLIDLAQALRCRRCEGGGAERFGPTAGEACPRCEGSGTHIEGWAYRTDGHRVEIGTIVEVPPTPYTGGRVAVATVVALDVDEPLATKSILRVVQ